MVPSEIGIIIPAFNEACTIAAIVSQASVYGQVILVDDGSEDETGRIAEKEGAIVIYHENNCGYDSALNSGFAKASEIGYEAVVTIDADGQLKPQLVPEFIKYIDEGYDVVVGIRNKKQRLLENFFALYTKIKFGIQDPLCGMKAYRMKIYDQLGYFDSFNSIGTEMVVFAQKEGFNIFQYPVLIKERYDTPRFGNAIFGNLKILKAMIKTIGKYGE